MSRLTRWFDDRRGFRLSLETESMTWGTFPPAVAGDTADELFDYLDRCQFIRFVVEADNSVVVTLHDADQQPWTFRFGGAETYCQVDGRRDKGAGPPIPGIWDLARSPAHLRDGRSVRLYRLESETSLSIYAEALEVAAPITTDT